MAQRERSKIPTRPLGETGHSVGLFSLGGEATVEKKDRRDEAVKIVDRAIDLGVNYIDTSPQYGEGGSEENIGTVMQDRRGEVFLASKTHGRTYDETMRLAHSSLSRLNTDRLDLYQIHNLQTKEELDTVLKRDGAIRAVQKLRDEGVVDNIGVTGHKNPSILLEAIDRHPFDCILMAFSAADAHYQSFQHLLQRAQDKEMGIIAMKTAAVGRIFDTNGITSMKQALGYVWSHPVSTAIVGISTLQQLQENVQLARDFEPYNSQQLKRLQQLTAEYGRRANFYKIEW